MFRKLNPKIIQPKHEDPLFYECYSIAMDVLLAMLVIPNVTSVDYLGLTQLSPVFGPFFTQNSWLPVLYYTSRLFTKALQRK